MQIIVLASEVQADYHNMSGGEMLAAGWLFVAIYFALACVPSVFSFWAFSVASRYKLSNVAKRFGYGGAIIYVAVLFWLFPRFEGIAAALFVLGFLYGWV